MFVERPCEQVKNPSDFGSPSLQLAAAARLPPRDESQIRRYRSGCQVVEGEQGISRTAVTSAGSWYAGRTRRISSAASRRGFGAQQK